MDALIINMNSVLSSVLLLSILLANSTFVEVSSVKSCTNGQECLNIGEKCIDGICQVTKIDNSCKNQYDCLKSDEYCINEKCQIPPLGNACKSDLDCIFGECKDEKCVKMESPFNKFSWIIYLVIGVFILITIIIVIAIFVCLCMS